MKKRIVGSCLILGVSLWLLSGCSLQETGPDRNSLPELVNVTPEDKKVVVHNLLDDQKTDDNPDEIEEKRII